MTVSNFHPSRDFASDPKYGQANLILKKFLPEIPKELDLKTIMDLSKQVVYELATDVDFCDDKHQASLLALEWLFRELSQKIALDRAYFFAQCEGLIIPSTDSQEESSVPWYNK